MSKAKTINYFGLEITGDPDVIDKVIYGRKIVDNPTITHNNNFKAMVETIKQFNQRFVPESDDAKLKTRWSLQFIQCMYSELDEFRDCLPWKHWKKYDFSNPFKHENIEFEIADLFIFLIGIAVMWNMDADTIVQRINEKMEVNVRRQKGGY